MGYSFTQGTPDDDLRHFVHLYGAHFRGKPLGMPTQNLLQQMRERRMRIPLHSPAYSIHFEDVLAEGGFGDKVKHIVRTVTGDRARTHWHAARKAAADYHSGSATPEQMTQHAKDYWRHAKEGAKADKAGHGYKAAAVGAAGMYLAHRLHKWRKKRKKEKFKKQMRDYLSRQGHVEEAVIQDLMELQNWSIEVKKGAHPRYAMLGSEAVQIGEYRSKSEAEAAARRGQLRQGYFTVKRNYGT